MRSVRMHCDHGLHLLFPALDMSADHPGGLRCPDVASRSRPGELDLILLRKTPAPAWPGFGTIGLAVALLFMSPRSAECMAGFGRNALINGDFAKLHDKLPVGWRVSGMPGSMRVEQQPS